MNGRLRIIARVMLQCTSFAIRTSGLAGAWQDRDDDRAARQQPRRACEGMEAGSSGPPAAKVEAGQAGASTGPRHRRPLTGDSSRAGTASVSRGSRSPSWGSCGGRRRSATAARGKLYLGRCRRGPAGRCAGTRIGSSSAWCRGASGKPRGCARLGGGWAGADPASHMHVVAEGWVRACLLLLCACGAHRRQAEAERGGCARAAVLSGTPAFRGLPELLLWQRQLSGQRCVASPSAAAAVHVCAARWIVR